MSAFAAPLAAAGKGAAPSGRGARPRADLAARILSLLLLLAAMTIAPACGRGGTEEDGAPAPPPLPEAPDVEGDERAVVPGEVVLLFPGPAADLLFAERRSVIPIASPEDRAKQCLEELFRGPQGGLLPAVPSGVRVREVYILEDGTAYADLSREILQTEGGSQRELLTVYAIVDTLALNVREIDRIGILVEGEARDTLSGHVFIRDPLPADFEYVEPSVWSAPPPAPAARMSADGSGA